MPSIIGNSTIGNLIGRTGPTGPTGSTGPAGLRGAIGLTAGPTGATGIWIANVVSDLVSSGITFELSNGTILGPLYGFTGPAGSYSDSRGNNLISGATFNNAFFYVDAGTTFVFQGICGGGNIQASLSPDGYEILLTVSPITGIATYGSTAANFVAYTSDSAWATTTKIGVTGSNSVLSFGLTADNGATGSSIKVYSEFVEPYLSTRKLDRGKIETTDDIHTACDSGGWTINLDKYSVYNVTTPIGITAFTTTADSSVLQSYTLFIQGADVWNLPSNVYFENTDRGIGKYGFLDGINIVHMWSENGGLTFNAAFVDRGMGFAGPFYSDSVGSCCWADQGLCFDNITPTFCATITIGEGIFTPLATCSQSCGNIGYCCSEGNCIPDSREPECNSIGGVFTTTPCTACGSPPPTGACCNAGICTDGVEQANCTGTWNNGKTCSDPAVQGDCAPILGCCINRDTCTIQNNVTQAACSALGSGFVWTASTTCTAADCTTGVCCVTYVNTGNKSCRSNVKANSCVTVPGFQTKIFYPNATCTDINCSNPPPPVLGACCNGNVCTETAQASCTGVWDSTKHCSDPVPPCVIPVYNYNISILNTDGSALTDLILPDGTPSYTNQFKIVLTTNDPNGARVQLPSTYTNTSGHVFTLTQTHNSTPYTGTLLPNNSEVLVTVSTPYDQFGRKTGIKNIIPVNMLDNLLNIKVSNNLNVYVVNTPPVPVEGCQSCPAGPGPQTFKVQSKFTINRMCMDCTRSILTPSTIDYPPVKTQQGSVNFCVSKNGSCGWDVKIDCINYGEIKDVYDCLITGKPTRTDFGLEDDFTTHLEAGRDFWEENRPQPVANAGVVLWSYWDEIKNIQSPSAEGCYTQRNAAIHSCKGCPKVFQSIGTCPGFVLDPYFSQVQFHDAPAAIGVRGIDETKQKEILNTLQDIILAQTDTDGKKMAFNPAKEGKKLTLNASELGCCDGQIIFGALQNGGEILNLGFNAPAGKTVRYLLWLNKFSASIEKASQCGQPEGCGQRTGRGLCLECAAGFTAEYAMASYYLNVSRLVINNNDNSIDTTLSCSDNLFSRDTPIGSSSYYLKNKTWGDATNCTCREVEGQPGILTGYPCPNWSLYLLGELQETDLIKTTVGGKDKYNLRYDIADTCIQPNAQWEQTAKGVGATPIPWESGWWKYIWFNCREPKYTLPGDRQQLYYKFMATMFNGRHCDTTKDLSCYPPNSCLLFGQYGTYNNCFCDDVLNQPVPVNLFGQSLDLEIVPNTPLNQLNFYVNSYSVNSTTGERTPTNDSAVLDIGYNSTYRDTTGFDQPINRITFTTGVESPIQPDYTTPFAIEDQGDGVEPAGIVVNAHIPATAQALQKVPTISVDAVFNNDGSMEYGTMLPKVSSGPNASGGFFVNIFPRLEQIRNSNTGEFGVVTEFTAEVWLLSTALNDVKYEKVDGIEYATDPLRNPLGFTFNFPELDSPTWYTSKGTDTKIHKLVFKLTAKTQIGTDLSGNPINRTVTSIFAYNYSLAPHSLTTTQFRNKLLDGTLVSLDCSQVQVLCDSLPNG
jgi:hypothetical protein